MARAAIAAGVGGAGSWVVMDGRGVRRRAVYMTTLAAGDDNRGFVALVAGQGAFAPDLVVMQGEVGRRVAGVAAGPGFLRTRGQSGMAKAAAHIGRRAGQGMVIRHFGAGHVTALTVASGRLQLGMAGSAGRLAVGRRVDVIVVLGLISS